ncbi:unnamed protein product [Fraxinus pennsylvanica]|uniref:Uncharacterized protein n=1 Tax=Fraxinus pennsylvanica TaxID=56036 RepID=A0AAD2DQ50_9LAMI|nr:unnamed protein product [Fraxinus pennsylvanica]
MEKEPRRLAITATQIVFLLILPLLFLDFFCGNIIPFDQCKSTFLPSSTSLILQHGEHILGNGRDSILRNYHDTVQEEHKSMKFLLSRVVTGAIVGLKFHGHLALNFSDSPGGHSMQDFKQFLKQAYNLKFVHVSEINRPNLVLLSRRKT